MSRETLIRATVASSLEFDVNVEVAKQIDRVMALAFATKANELGSRILRAEGLDKESLRRAIYIVSRRLIKEQRMARSMAERVSVAALQEFIFPHCASCHGLGNLYHDGKVVVVCKTCDGTGLRRYSDADREAMVGSKYSRRAYNTAYDIAIKVIREAASRAAYLAELRLTMNDNH